jgi:hypothetical protein
MDMSLDTVRWKKYKIATPWNSIIKNITNFSENY